MIICGDLFHTNSNSNYIFYRVYKLLNKYKGKFIAIPGTHDLIHNNINTLEKTTIGSLALTGVLNLQFKSFLCRMEQKENHNDRKIDRSNRFVL